MKSFLLLFLLSMSILVSAQKSPYAVTSFLEQGPKAPNTHYIGEAWLSSLLQADADMNYNISAISHQKIESQIITRQYRQDRN
jgi:hypothetical protein